MPTRRKGSPRPPVLVLTCEHAGRRVPRRYAHLFRGAEPVLASHRGWDPGAQRVAQALARRLGVPLLATPWTRLLADANRSLGNPSLWSTYTAALPREERQRLLDRYWRPHRRRVHEAVEGAIAAGRRVLHVAVHSFTPVLDGVVREVDVGLLFDPGRRVEREVAARWRALLRERRATLRIRRNAPYRGVSDGLSRPLRRTFPTEAYVAIELELNQGLLETPFARPVTKALGDCLEDAVGARRSKGGRT